MSLTQVREATTELENEVAVPHEQEPLVLHMPDDLRLTDEQFLQLCRKNDIYRLERTAKGDIEIMAPAAWDSGSQNSELSGQLRDWAKTEGSGKEADSSAGYRLPNGALRSPDASWVLFTRLNPLRAANRGKYLPLAPDFAAELRSPSDRLSPLPQKMEEYSANGVRLALLLDAEDRTVTIYRPNIAPVTLNNPATVDCSPELPGPILDIQAIFDA